MACVCVCTHVCTYTQVPIASADHAHLDAAWVLFFFCQPVLFLSPCVWFCLWRECFQSQVPCVLLAAGSCVDVVGCDVLHVRVSYVVCHTSCINVSSCNISYIISDHVSYIMYHVSCIIYRILCIIYHISYIIFDHVSCIMYHVLYIIYHISYIRYHTSYLIMYQISCIMSYCVCVCVCVCVYLMKVCCAQVGGRRSDA